MDTSVPPPILGGNISTVSAPVSVKKRIGWILLLMLALLPLVAYASFSGWLGGQTLEKFALKEVSPEDQEGGFSVIGQPVFVFTQKIGIAEADLGKYIRLSPPTAGTWHLEKNGQVIYFSSDKKQANNFPQTFSYNTVYTVTIDKQLRSITNQTLEKPVHISFRTKPNPAFGISINHSLLTTAPGKEVHLDLYTNDSTLMPIPPPGTPYTVEIRQASKEDFLRAFTYTSNKFPLYSTNPSPMKVIKQIQASVATKENSSYLPLSPDIFPSVGLYLVTVKNNQGSQDLFVNVTNQIVQVFVDSVSISVVTSTHEGKRIPQTQVSFYKTKDEPKLIDSRRGDGAGLAKSTQDPSKVEFVFSQNMNDLAIAFTKQYGFYGYGDFFSGNPYHIFSFSDRPVYRSGDLVHYKAVVRKKDNGVYTVPAGTYYIELIENYVSSTTKHKYQAVALDANGTITKDFTLPRMITGTAPQVVLFEKNANGTYKQIDSLPLIIESYRKPDMDITATTSEKEYISSDSAHMSVVAKTTYGQPLTNVDFSYRVLASDITEERDRTQENFEGMVSSMGSYGGGTELTTGVGRFDEKGIAKVAFSTSLPASLENSQIATLEITPRIGASPSIGRIAKLIHRGEFALFIDDLVGGTQEGIRGVIHVRSHDIPRRSAGVHPLTVSLHRVISYDSKELVQSQSITSDDNGNAPFRFPTVDVGSYEIVVQAQDERGNTVTARNQIYIDQLNYTPSTSQYTLTTTSQKNIYRVGETAQVTATANFPMRDVVVVLTNASASVSHIISLQQLSVQAPTMTIPVPIKAEYGQQVAVDVFAITDGHVVRANRNIPIDQTVQQIHTTISFDKENYQPGDSVKATIRTTDADGQPVAADNSLAVIDASLLQIGSDNRDMYTSFYGYTPSSSVLHFDSTVGIIRNLGGGGGGCFLAGTKVLMADGSSKNIELVTVGDKILTRASDLSSQRVEDTVTATHRHAVTDYLTINNRLHVTWSHRIYLNNRWQEAQNARVGDTLLDANGNQITITSITPNRGQFIVYNLTTSHYHTFFAEGLYVHNEKGVGPRVRFADTAYWNPHIATGTDGQATVSFTLPDNVTTFTAQTFSNTARSFGQATAQFIAKKDITIIPAMSNFYYQGDAPVIATLVQNASDKGVDAAVTLVIKETGYSKEQSLHIGKGDFGQVLFPITIPENSQNLSFQIAVKGKGETLDSVLLTKPILPRGTIVSSWMSYVGSKTLTFSPSHTSLDVNSLTFSVVPHVVSRLFSNQWYSNSHPSVDVGISLYSYSTILARTRDGDIVPTAYHYAKLRNEFREKVAMLAQNRVDQFWVSQYPSGSFVAMNLWLAHGLSQAASVHMLDEITNISTLVDGTKAYIRQHYPATNNQMTPFVLPETFSQPSQDINDMRQEQIIRHWVLGETSTDPAYLNTPEELAIRVLDGDKTALDKLRQASLPSASDRFIWDGAVQESSLLPALALITSGTEQDAERAVKGLSVAYNSSYDDQLAILAGVLYAQRKHIVVDRPTVRIDINGVTVSDGEDLAYTATLSPKNASDGKVTLQITTSGQVPVYTTVVQMSLQKSDILSPSAESSPLDQFFHMVGMSTTPQGEAKELDLGLKRSIKDVDTGQDIPSIAQGTSGIIALTATSPFTGTNASSPWTTAYSYMLEDALSPAFVYLDQHSGNSPQYQSSLAKIFPGDNISSGGGFIPMNYSDEMVFFQGTGGKASLIFPYVVYNVVGGTFYQPKTSLVFPILGLIVKEK